MKRAYLIRFAVVLMTLPLLVNAHHNPIAYDGKKQVKISGTVTSAYFGNPHSRYEIEVTNDKGEVEKWLLMTEDPKDARNLGFEDAIRNIKEGDRITVVGWPHRFNRHEIRGHRLIYQDGTVVMMRRGNYIWRGSMRRIYRMVSGRDEIDDAISTLPPTMTPAGRLIALIEEDSMIPRIAYEVRNKTATLIGLYQDGEIEFPGITELFECHTKKEDFTSVIDIGRLTAAQRVKIIGNKDFISEYNATLARYWEQDVESC